MKTQIIRPVDDLNQDVYDFVFLADLGRRPQIWLEGFYMQQRASKRHKWTNVSGYYRYRSNQDYLLTMKREDVTIPPQVVNDAKAVFAAEINKAEVV